MSDKTAKPKMRVVKDAYRNGAAVKMARQVCSELESGEAIGVAYIVVKRSGFVSTGWESPPNKSAHELHSGVYMLAHRLGKGLAE